MDVLESVTNESYTKHVLAVALTGALIFFPFHAHYSKKMSEISSKYPITYPQYDNFMNYSVQDRKDFQYYRRLNTIIAGAAGVLSLPALMVGFRIARKRHEEESD